MANPKGNPDTLKHFEPIGDKPLSGKPLQVRVDQETYDYVKAMGRNGAEWLRRVIVQAVAEETNSTKRSEKPRG